MVVRICHNYAIDPPLPGVVEVLNQETYLPIERLANSRWRIFQGLIHSIAVFGLHRERFASRRDARFFTRLFRPAIISSSLRTP
jgi:hypothetical protein